METLYRVAAKALSIIKSRLFCAAALAVVCAVLIGMVSLNMKAVTIVSDDTSRVVLTLDDDPVHVLADAGVKLQEGDEVVTSGGLESVQVNRAFDVEVNADGISTIIRMTGGTVADALTKVGVTLQKDDKVSEKLTADVTDGMDITVDRIVYKDYTKTETIKHTTSIRYTNTICYGRTYVKQSGSDGSKTVSYRMCIKNGKVVSNDVTKETVTKKAVTQIELVGLKSGMPLSKAPFDIALDKNGQPLHYSKVYTGRATAYSSDRGYAGTGTASGRRAQVGVVAVNPKKIPYGTKLYICSADGSYVYGYAIAGDTGTALREGSALVDLFFNNYEECLNFGAKRLNVYVIG